jgi:branched-chain amino acid transport system substrate-binding protein
MQRSVWLAVLAVAALGVALASPAQSQSKPPIKIGNITFLSGPAASAGQLLDAMADIAVEDINAAGGINGSLVAKQTEDAQLDPAQAVLMYRKLAAEGAVATLGPGTGTQWQTVAALSPQVKLPAATVNAVAPGITVRPWTIRLQVADDTLIPDLVDQFVAKFPTTKKVVIASDAGESSTIAAYNLFKAAAEKHKIEVLGGNVGFTGKTMDLSPIAIEIKRLDPDAVWAAALPPQTFLLAKALAAQDFTKPRLGNIIFWPGNFVATIGDAGKNWYVSGVSTNTNVTGDNELYKTVAARFLERAAKIPKASTNIANATVAYDTLMVYADILRKAGVDGNTPILEAREKMKEGFLALKEWRGLNLYKMRPNGDAETPQRLLVVDSATGQWKDAD